MEKGYRERMHISPSYVSVLREASSKDLALA